MVYLPSKELIMMIFVADASSHSVLRWGKFGSRINLKSAEALTV